MKRIKMLLYGEPGVGKSVFASKAPKPFFITTDGNYEWLEDFGADPNAHIQVNSWTEAKEAFEKSYDEYETIVIDLLEDLFKWCEYEFCLKSKIDHVSDIGYGKGYDITRNEFFLEIAKLLGRDKNIILITHGITFVTKDRRGVEHTRYAPSNRIPDKVMDMIEGRLRYCLRCYLKAKEQADGTLVKNRYLSLIPKENEFGIIRGVDETKMPQDIPLDFNEFAKAIGFDAKASVATPDVDVVEDAPKRRRRSRNTVNTEEAVEEPVIEQTQTTPIEQMAMTTPVSEPMPTSDEVSWHEEEKKEEKKEEPKREMTNAEKIAAIKAKLAELKK